MKMPNCRKTSCTCWNSSPQAAVAGWSPRPMYYWSQAFGTISRRWTETGSGRWRYNFLQPPQANAEVLGAMQRGRRDRTGGACCNGGFAPSNNCIGCRNSAACAPRARRPAQLAREFLAIRRSGRWSHSAGSVARRRRCRSVHWYVRDPRSMIGVGRTRTIAKRAA